MPATPRPKLPKKLKIGHSTWTLEYGEETKEEGSDWWGRCNYAKEIIQIKKDLPSGSTEAEVIIHECLHALYDYFNLRDMEGMNKGREEHQVTVLAKGLTALFTNNPKFATYWSQLVKE